MFHRRSTCIFFFHRPSPPAISTLSLHDALPISSVPGVRLPLLRESLRQASFRVLRSHTRLGEGSPDRKSTRLNSSHVAISYAVFCLKKKKKHNNTDTSTIYIRSMHESTHSLRTT